MKPHVARWARNLVDYGCWRMPLLYHTHTVFRDEGDIIIILLYYTTTKGTGPKYGSLRVSSSPVLLLALSVPVTAVVGIVVKYNT